jgi:CxxC motif-containing protein
MKEITCIVCPNGCRLAVEQDGDGFRVSGAACKRGTAFAEAEMTHPMRSLTTTAATAFADMPRLPVKTSAEIPKDKVFEAMELINHVRVKERVKQGDVVLSGVFGASFVATIDL